MMKVMFKNGTSYNCSVPMEQKLFKAEKEAGWSLTFSMLCDLTSTSVDELFTANNICELVFTSTLEENENISKTISILNYEKIGSVVIKHSESKEQTRIDIRLVKGV